MLFTGGLALGLLALLLLGLRYAGLPAGVGPALDFGVNAIAVFFFSAILSRTFGLIHCRVPTGSR
ncbi:MAG: hypothetical protein WKG07_12875 [Hymenobacter sp.]